MTKIAQGTDVVPCIAEHQHLAAQRHPKAECPAETTMWKVDASFYVVAESAVEAERMVTRSLNSKAVQDAPVKVRTEGHPANNKIASLREVTGDADVHEGDTIEWDVEG